MPNMIQHLTTAYLSRTVPFLHRVPDVCHLLCIPIRLQNPASPPPSLRGRLTSYPFDIQGSAERIQHACVALLGMSLAMQRGGGEGIAKPVREA